MAPSSNLDDAMRRRRTKDWVLSAIRPGRVRLQPLYRRLHLLSLRGRGYGLAEFAASGEVALLDRLRRDHPRLQTIFDVGANVGGWSSEASHRWPASAIYAFEPAASCFAALTAAVGAKNVTCVNAAVGDRPGEAVLHAVPGFPGLSSLHQRDLAVQRLAMTESETVKVETLDQYCATNHIEHIDLLKIDTEGHELAVLQGAAELLGAGRIERIQFEFGGTNIDARTYLRDFVRLLEPRYRISRVLVDGLEPLRYSEAEEIFVTTNFYAERH